MSPLGPVMGLLNTWGCRASSSPSFSLTPRVAVAGGVEKQEAIRACLKGKYFNVLITDAYVAEALVQG